MKSSLILALCIFIIACSNISDADMISIKTEIAKLKTNDEKTAYLENIHLLDQKVRTDEDTVLATYGHGSKEYKDHWKFINQTDELNLAKVEAYLAAFGHPKKSELSDQAVHTPYIVIHHQSTAEPRRRNFQYLEDAYKSGDLDSGAFAFYLNRFYEFEFGHRLEMKNPFTEEIEIDTLVKALNPFIQKYHHEND
ncbi:MAG: hypothetical protein AB8F74_06925 [Saprospiraceae bacterium]